MQYLPENIEKDDIGAEETPPTSLAIGAASEFLKNISLGLNDVGLHLKEDFYNTFSPGKFLTDQDYKKSQYYRPGLNFPHGVSSNIAKVKSQEFDKQQLLNSLISHMPDTFASKAIKTTYGLMGLALNPIGLASGEITEATIASKAPAILDAVGDSRIAQASTRTALGATEGLLTSAPFVAANYDYSKEIGQKESPIEIMAQLGGNALLGATLRGITGFSSPITPEANREAIKTAIGQLSSDKNVDIKDIVQQGYQDEREKETTIPVLSDNQKNVYSNHVENFTNDINKKKLDLDNKLSSYDIKLPDKEENIIEPNEDFNFNESINNNDNIPEKEKNTILNDYNTIKNGIKNNQILKTMLSTQDILEKDSPPGWENVTKDQLIDSSKKVNSITGDLTYDPITYNQINEENKTFPETANDLSHEENLIQSMKDQNLLKEEELDHLNNFSKRDKQIDNFYKSLINFATCMKENI